MVCGLPVFHTGDMSEDARPTAFVSEADGIFGAELISALVARGHQVFALTRSVESARIVRGSGAVAVIGDLLTPGRWQDEAAADWVFHLPSPQPAHPIWTRRTRERTALAARARVLMDRNLFEAVSAGTTRRIVYVADIRLYGAVGTRPIT